MKSLIENEVQYPIRINHKLGNKVTLRAIKPDGRKVLLAKDLPNLITDHGMYQLGLREFRDVFVPQSSSRVSCRWGDDSTANSTDSGAITASQSGTTVTASAGIFTLAMEGDLIKFDTGEEVYLQTYVSPTEFTAASSETIASSEFTVWDVDRTGLGNQVQATTTLNGSSTYVNDAGILKGTAVFIFSALGSNQTLREIGWVGYSTSTLCARVVVADIALLAGDQLEVTTEFSVTQNYTTSTAIDPTTGEGDFSCDVQIEGIGIMGLNGVSTLEPHYSSDMYMATENIALTSYGSVVRRDVANKEDAIISAAPTSAPWVRTKTFNWSTSQGNRSNIWAFLIGISGNSSSQDASLILKFSAAKAKTNLQTLEIVIPYTWDRNLSN